MKLLTEQYASKIAGTLSCYDRIVLTGTLPVLSNAQHMTAYLFQHTIRIFDYARFAEPYRDQLKEHTVELARQEGIEIQYINSSKVRKESLIEEKLKKRGTQPGLVHILSVMEGCNTYKPW